MPSSVCVCGDCTNLTVWSRTCGWYPTRKTDCHDCYAELAITLPPDWQPGDPVPVETCRRCAEQAGGSRG
jgi:hypothetical protein